MCCGVIPILFGWFLRVPSLHALVFIWKKIFVTCLFFFKLVLEVVKEKRGEKGRRGKDAWSVKYKGIELCTH